MRASIPCLLALLALAAPAHAQGLPSSNLNSINDALAGQAQFRSLQQQQQADVTALRMDAQRNVLFRPGTDYAAPIVLRRGRGFSPSGPHHTGGIRSGRTRLDRSLDAGICVGC
ncbi:hypothetical protein [Methylobacterium oxalidis]|uniref:Uncharacterized protein n=1 Tax=Methylobacterium oxalidis TaxID=944322 RepID=A0A512IZJ7_9HYPH|nr:hypothetical protein [Methylobacterium oxalidis]GEP03130.1 hypothetical protein MOX02_11680 [Methylobacterium oxalidis]GJE30344.1 hypothetical protein LDDCCGHA_0511 [Methylobacterium oxalidis]GLS67389.1 hypothetical protein GCM10007888_57730 [Methylobacterium oxalidis]